MHRSLLGDVESRALDKRQRALHMKLKDALDDEESALALIGDEGPTQARELESTRRATLPPCLIGWYAAATFLQCLNTGVLWSSVRDGAVRKRITTSLPRGVRQVGTWGSPSERVLDVVVAAARYAGLARTDAADPSVLWVCEPVSTSWIRSVTGPSTVNILPGLRQAAQKVLTARLLNRFATLFPTAFAFVPPTFVLPDDAEHIAGVVKGDVHSDAAAWIVKPSRGLQGEGITLVRTLRGVPPADHVVQRYVHPPACLGGLKFDLRLYVVVSSVAPLVIWRHEEGLARFATVPYVFDDTTPMDDPSSLHMHLTNYSLNRQSARFADNECPLRDDRCTKRTLTTALAQMSAVHGEDAVRAAMKSVDEAIVWTLVAVQPGLAISYDNLGIHSDLKGRVSQTRVPSIQERGSAPAGRCFHVVGFDVMFDAELRPYVLEFNASPSLAVPDPVDWRVKAQVVGDTMTLMSKPFEARKPSPVNGTGPNSALLAARRGSSAASAHTSTSLPLFPPYLGQSTAAVEDAWRDVHGPAARFRGLRLLFDGAREEDCASVAVVTRLNETMVTSFVKACGSRGSAEMSSGSWTRFCRTTGIVNDDGGVSLAEVDLMFLRRTRCTQLTGLTLNDFVDLLHFDIVPRVYPSEPPLEGLFKFARERLQGVETM